MKRILTLFITLTLMLSVTANAPAERLGDSELPDIFYQSNIDVTGLISVFPDGVTEVTSKTLTCYNGAPENTLDFTLYFMNGADDLPFVNVEDVPVILDAAYNVPDDVGNRYTTDIIGSSLYISRENGSFAVFDFSDQTICFDNRSMFVAPAGVTAWLDLTNSESKACAPADALLSMSVTYMRTGKMSEFRLGDYQIPMLLIDHTGYVPLQTISDLFLSDIYYSLLYNGDSMFMAPNGSLTADPGTGTPGTFTELYYTKEATAKSGALTQLTYNELCLVLDSFYGLAEEHHVTSFDDLFIETGMISRLLSNDPADTLSALDELTLGFFSDYHSSVTAHSYLLGSSTIGSAAGDYMGTILEKELTMMIKYDIARMERYPDGVPGYEEFGDTAYITFDTFYMDPTSTYTDMEYTNNSKDTLELILYANSRILREDSPITNVVLDLTMNGGGMADTAVMTLAWLLGGAKLTVRDTSDGSEGTLIYSFDGNADGEFNTEKDALGMNCHIYCLISPKSFSCGNLVPAMLKNSHRATLIGERSGGGACVVLPLSTADGNMFCISGHKKLSTVQNGIFYSVDQGVDPDFAVSDPAHLYDREYLTEYIHQLP